METSVLSPENEADTDVSQQTIMPLQEEAVAQCSKEVNPVESVKEVTETVETLNEEKTLDTEKLSALKYDGNFAVPVAKAMQGLIRCKIKSEAKSASLDMKLQETIKKEKMIQEMTADMRQHIENAKAHRDLQNVEFNMITEDFLTMSKVISAHKDEYESIVAILRKAEDTKTDVDKRTQNILEENMLIQHNHEERVKKVTRSIAELEMETQEKTKKRQEQLEFYRALLSDKKRKCEEIENEKNRIKSDFESKNAHLQEEMNRRALLKTEVKNLLKIEKDAIQCNQNLKSSYDLLQNELRSNEHSLKESIMSYEKTQQEYQVVTNQLEDSKMKNNLLSGQIRAAHDMLTTTREERQGALYNYQAEIERLQNQHKEVKNRLNSLKQENVGRKEDLENRREIFLQLQGEYQGKKSVYNELDIKIQTDLGLLALNENHLKLQKEKLHNLYAEKEKLRGVYENMQAVLETKKAHCDNFEKVKNELQTIMKATDNDLTEKSAFYEKLKQAALTTLEKLKTEQESMVKNEERILQEKENELDKLMTGIKSLNEMTAVKKERADNLYSNFTKVESEHREIERKIMHLKNNPPSVTTPSGPSTSQGVKRGILKSPEKLPNVPGKKVTFDLPLNDGLDSEGSVDRLFEELFGNVTKNVKEKRPTSEELFDDMIRRSPPQKDKN